MASGGGIDRSGRVKGMFTQGVVVLLRAPVAVEELSSYLPEFPFLRISPPGEHWEFGGATAVVGFRPEVNGCVLIDSVNQVWPDHMGDSKNEPMLLGAWSMGHFGPLAFPGGLVRAAQHAWSWPEARAGLPEHVGFIRLRITYGVGAEPNDRVMPADCDPRAELSFLMDLVQGVLRHPAALCYFNPNGEVVASLARIEEQVVYHRGHDLPPLNLWSNVRLFNLPGDWLMMDSIGNGQLDLVDHEVVFPKNAAQPGEVDRFIRTATLYILDGGDVIKTGHTMDGAGVRWQATRFEQSLCTPPREVICWVPQGTKGIPPEVAQRARKADAVPAEPKPKSEAKRPWWKRW